MAELRPRQVASRDRSAADPITSAELRRQACSGAEIRVPARLGAGRPRGGAGGPARPALTRRTAACRPDGGRGGCDECARRRHRRTVGRGRRVEGG
ncbi:hypothetical protein ACR6C2_10620 [Streptomyces sp. INA 01156]